MKKIFLILVLLLCVPAYGAMTYDADNFIRNVSYATGQDKATNPIYLFMNEVEGIIEDATLENGNLITFDNGLTIDNATNNAFEWNENSDELIWTFGSNTVTVSSGDVTLFDFGTVVLGFDQFSVNSVTYTYPTADGTNGQVLQTNGSGTLSWAANAGGVTDLDTAYNGGNTIDVDGSAVTLTVSLGDNNPVAVFAQNDSTNDPTAVQITSAADAANAISLDIDGQTTGRDIEGTGASFYVEGDGSIVGVDLDITGAAGITLQNDATILNDVDNEIQFSDGAEDISFGFGTSDTLTITTDSEVGTVNWGDVDAFTGIQDIAFDASSGGVTMATDGDADDLTVGITGATNSSLFLVSSGTGSDAIRVNASAGSIDIDAANGYALDVAGAAAQDIVVTNSGGSIKLEATEAAADAVVIDASNAAGGIDMDCGTAGFDLTVTGGDLTLQNTAAKDIVLDATQGRVLITGTESAADAIILTADGAAGEIALSANTGGIDIDAASGDIKLNVAGNANDDITLTNTNGTSVTEGSNAIQLLASAGGIGIESNANLDDAIYILADGGATSEISIQNDQGTSESSIEIISDDGGIDITCATGKNMDLTGGQIALLSNEAAGSAIALTTNTGAAETIVITNTQGTSVTEDAGAIQLTATAGGIQIQSDGNLNDAVCIRADGGATAEMSIHNDQGTSESSIDIISDEGGIDITCATGKNMDLTGGQITLLSNEAAASAIALTTNTGAAETIVLTNTQGTDPAAINLTASAGAITLTTGLASSGVLVNTSTYEHKVKYYSLSQGVTAATEVIVGGGGTGLICTSLDAGVNEQGSTEGYVSVGDDEDILLFSIPLPDDFVDTGTQADLIMEFDISEQAAEECNMDIRIFEYDGTANIAAIITDTIVAANDNTRAWKGLVTNSAGIGNEADIEGGDELIIEITATADADDFFIYGMRLTYRVGLQATN